jgi:cytoskeletal protein RodZ
MQRDNQLPLDAWAQTLSEARAQQGLSLLETARELMLSPAQLRDIESGSMQSFHGSGYYVRAVQKYAKRLAVELDPAVEALSLTDSQIGMQRLSKTPKPSMSSATATLSKRQSALENGLTVAHHRSRSSRIGMILGLILIVAVALGVYLSVEEGWPNKQAEQSSENTQAQLPRSVQTESIEVTAQPTSNTTAPGSPDLSSDVALPAANLGSNPEPNLASSLNTEVVIAPETTHVPEAVPQSMPEAIPAPPPPADLLEARFTADCWVEVRYKDGRVEQRVYTDRDILTLPLDEVQSMVFGNAQAVKAEKRGQSFDVMAFARGRNVARINEADLREQ